MHSGSASPRRLGLESAHDGDGVFGILVHGEHAVERECLGVEDVVHDGAGDGGGGELVCERAR